MLIQQTLNGLMLGAVYALVAMGFSLVYSVRRVVNLAQHELFMIAGFAAMFLYSAGWGAVLSLVGAVFVTAGFGILLYLFALRPLEPSNALGAFVTTLAFGLILRNLAIAHYGSGVQPFTVGFAVPGHVQIASSVLSVMDLILVGVALGVAVLLTAGIEWSWWGRRVRAVASDPVAARLLGIRTESVVIAVVIIASALAALAGLLTALRFENVSAFVGTQLALKALVVMFVGGLGDVRGAFLAGIAIGLSEALLQAYAAPGYSEALIWLSFIVILWLRPGGLVRTRLYEREV